MDELTRQLAPQVANDLRLALLSSLLTQPLRWRIRRTDRFTGARHDLASQETHLDFRIRGELVDLQLNNLQQAYRAEGMWANFGNVDDFLRDDGLQTADSIDTLIPVAWIAGPPLDLKVERDGQVLSPLSRREVADLMSRILLRYIDTLQLVLDEHDAFDEKSGLTIGWCLLAADTMALREKTELRALSDQPFDSDKNLSIISMWMHKNMQQLGYSVEESRDAIARLHPEMKKILQGADAILEQWRAFSAPGAFVHPTADAFNHCLNPLLMHRTFLKWVMWDSRADEWSGLRCRDAHACLECFLTMCLKWNELLRLALGARDPRHSQAREVAEAFLGFADKISSSWPIVVRTTIPLEHNLRITYQQLIPMPTRRKDQAIPDGFRRKKSPSEYYWGILRGSSRFVHIAWGWLHDEVLHQLAHMLHFFSPSSRPLRRRRFVQMASQEYALSLNDALGYHVEVTIPDAEMELVPCSAFIKMPERDFLSPPLLTEMKTSHARVLFPYRKLPPHALFGRVTDDSRSHHHFYTTRGHNERLRHSAPDDGRFESEHPGLPALVVRYRIANQLHWSNWLLSIVLSILSLATLRASLLQSINRDVGHFSLVHTTGPVIGLFFVVLALFAFEKWTNDHVTYYLQRPAKLALWSFMLFLWSVAIWAISTKPRSFFHVPQQVTAWWPQLANLVVGNSWIFWTAALLPVVAVGSVILVGTLTIVWVRHKRRQAEWSWKWRRSDDAAA